MKGKVVWITGASSGIGEALAYTFARKGAKLVLSARREAELMRVKNNCKMNQEDVFILPLDIEKPETFATLFQRVIARFGTLDILVNNAGISQRSLVKDTPLAVDKRLMDVNYIGTVALTKTVLPTLLAKQNGQIVVVTSAVGKFGSPWRSGYSASKHALHGFLMPCERNCITIILKCFWCARVLCVQMFLSML